MLYTYGVHKWIIKDEDVDIPVDLSGHDLNWYFNQHSLLDRIKDKLQSGYMI